MEVLPEDDFSSGARRDFGITALANNVSDRSLRPRRNSGESRMAVVGEIPAKENDLISQ